MSGLRTLARPYAKAAFDLAAGEDALGRWEEMLGLASQLVSEEAVAELLDSPLVSSEQVAEVMQEAAGDAFSDRFRDFLAVLGANERLALLPEITALFARLRAEAERRLHVRVVSALPLEDEQASRLREALARRFEREIELENEIDPEIIGGAVVYAGDQVIDGSVRGRLRKLSNNLVN